MKVLQGILCAAAVFAMTAGAYADGRNARTVADMPKEVKPGMLIDQPDTGRQTPEASNPLGGGTLVYSDITTSRYVSLPDPNEFLYDDIRLSAEGDLALFRQMASYQVAWIATGTPSTLELYTNLRRDSNGDGTGGPVPGDDGIYENSACYFPEVDRVFRNPANANGEATMVVSTMQVCTPDIPDTGPALDEGFWLGGMTPGGSDQNGGIVGPYIVGTTAGMNKAPQIGFSDNVIASDGGSGGEEFGFFIFGCCDRASYTAQVSAQVVPAVPTVSEWGLITIVLLVLTGGTIVLRKARPRTVSA